LALVLVDHVLTQDVMSTYISATDVLVTTTLGHNLFTTRSPQNSASMLSRKGLVGLQLYTSVINLPSSGAIRY